MNQGTLGALTYRIPQRFIGDQNPSEVTPQQSASGLNLPTPKDHLASVEGLTDKYYDINSQLENYANSMAKDYGIDVTKPDYTQPGGGQPFKTYHKLAAQLLYTANDLASSHDMNKLLLQNQAQGNILMNKGFNPRQQMSSQTDPSEMFTSTNIDDQVKQANDFLQKDFYTQRDADKANASIKQPLVNYYQNLIQNDPQNAGYYQRQLAALGSATPKTPYSAFQQHPGSGNKQPGIALLKKITNLKQGVWGNGTFKPVTREGKVYLENKEMAGDSMGQYIDYDQKGQPIYRPKITKAWLKDPQTGEVFVEYADPNIPIESVSNQPGSSVTTTFISNNPKYGDSSKMLETADQLGLLDDSGSSVDDYLLHPNQEQIRENVRNTGKKKAESVDAARTAIVNQLDKVKDTGWLDPTRNSVGYKLPDGREIEFAKHNKKKEFYIKKPDEFFKSKEGTENLSPEQVVKVLSSLGYFDKYLNEEKSKPKTVVQNGHTYTLNEETGEYE